MVIKLAMRSCSCRGLMAKFTALNLDMRSYSCINDPYNHLMAKSMDINLDVRLFNFFTDRQVHSCKHDLKVWHLCCYMQWPPNSQLYDHKLICEVMHAMLCLAAYLTGKFIIINLVLRPIVCAAAWGNYSTTNFMIINLAMNSYVTNCSLQLLSDSQVYDL